MNDQQQAVTISDRQKSILEFAQTRGEVGVEMLASAFNVTPQTIRRDLTHLCQRRLLQRVHGGAVLADRVENLGYDARRQLNTDSKIAIGLCAAALIPNDSSLFINIGTTTEQVANCLLQHLGLLVITNNINVANTMRVNESSRIVIAGGTVRREDGGIVGETTIDFINQFKVDYAIIGASAVEEDGALLDYDIREVRVAQTIIENARAVILVADAEKFSRSAPVRIGHIQQIDDFVTDQPLSDPLANICREHSVKVTIASAGEVLAHHAR